MNRTRQPVRIMDLRGTYKGGGGPDKTILLSAAMHDPKKVYVLVTYLRDPADGEFEIEDRAKALGINYVDVPDRKLFDWPCILRLNRILRRQNLQLVHAHDDKSSLYAFILKILNPQVKVMYTCHLYSMYRRSDFPDWKGYLSFRARKAARFFLMARSHRPILAVSEAVRRTLIQEGLPEKDVETLYNGIDIEHWRRQNGQPLLRKELEIPDRAFLIGTVARIAFQKDLPTFFQVAANLRKQHPQVYFAIVGDGENSELEKARQQARTYGVEEFVFFTGHRNDLLDVYSSFDLFLMTSVSEGLPNTVLEAMAMGVPVVSTAVDGVPELIRDGNTGFLCTMKNVNCLVSKIEALLKSRELHARFAVEGRATVCKTFSFTDRVSRMEEYYEQFMNRGSATSAVLGQEG